MYNERNILTMENNEIKSDTLTISNKFGVNVRNLFLSRSCDGMLFVIIDNCSDEVKREFKFFLWKYLSGITDINGIDVGTSEIDSPAVEVRSIKNESEYNKIYSMCISKKSFSDIL